MKLLRDRICTQPPTVWWKTVWKHPTTTLRVSLYSLCCLSNSTQGSPRPECLTCFQSCTTLYNKTHSLKALRQEIRVANSRERALRAQVCPE